MTKLACRVATFGLLALAACNSGEETGNATINYTLAISGTACDSAALGIGGLGVVDTVRATLVRGDTMIVREEPCDPNVGIDVDTAPAGNYDLVVEGLDAVGDAVMDNAKHLDSQSIEIIGGSSQEVEADLFPTPGVVTAQMDILVDGQFAQCQFLDVKTIELTMFRNSTIMHTHAFDVCSTMPGYNQVPDEDGLIEGALLNQIVVKALDDAGTEVDEFTIPVMPPPGAGKTVQISITCDNTDCMGTFDGIEGGGGGGGATSGGTGSATSGGGDTAGGTAGDPTGGDSTGA